jgi:hypothetical protein
LVRNHVGLEELGIPSVAIIQEYFVEDAAASGEAFGLPNPTVVVTPETFTSLTDTEVRQAVDKMIEDIIIGLTKPLPEPKERVFERVTTRGPKDEFIEFAGKDYAECFKKLNDRFLDWGWSDGYPLVPPTEEAVSEMLGGTKRSPDDTVVEKFVPGNARATVRDIAVNAVMAGCKPEFLPVIITAVEAMHNPDGNLLSMLRSMTMSTGPHAPLFLVNGPVSEKIGINSGSCSLGNAGPERLSFANVAIGRAVRLCLMNVGNCYPGIMDQDTIGSPAKFSMVIAENEKKNPWEPYHVEKGFRADESTVTCFYGHSLIEMADLDSENAEALMNTFALRIIGIGQTLFMSFYPVILLCPDHARVLVRDGWTKNDIRQYLHLHCCISAEKYRRSKVMSFQMGKKWIETADSRAMIPLYEKFENIDIIVVGGAGGKSAAYLGLFPKPYPIKS